MKAFLSETTTRHMFSAKDYSESSDRCSTWCEEELSELFSCYSNWHGSGDVVKIVMNQLSNCGFNRSREDVSEQLHNMGYVIEESSTSYPVSSHCRLIVTVSSHSRLAYLLTISGHSQSVSHCQLIVTVS